MFSYIARRLFYMIPTLLIISVISFTLIQLPPGDYLTSYITALTETGESVDESVLASLKKRYGLDQPFYVQYFKWIKGIFYGDFGESFIWNMPVSKLIGERIMLTVIISLFSLIFTYIVAIPIGIYSATHQYSLPDYGFTFIG
ncbi:ABC transporter permease, partial [Candidatus Aerophobetes bacterium]|nr:ABC transporter permease [Candidatus Aerophobetes bacterium]